MADRSLETDPSPKIGHNHAIDLHLDLGMTIQDNPDTITQTNKIPAVINPMLTTTTSTANKANQILPIISKDVTDHSRVTGLVKKSK